jgi:hypothetical protein
MRHLPQKIGSIGLVVFALAAAGATLSTPGWAGDWNSHECRHFGNCPWSTKDRSYIGDYNGPAVAVAPPPSAAAAPPGIQPETALIHPGGTGWY